MTTAEKEQPSDTEQVLEIKPETFTEEVVIPSGEEAQPSEIQVEVTTAEVEQPKETKITEQVLEVKPETFTEEVVIPQVRRLSLLKYRLTSQLQSWNNPRKPRPLSKTLEIKQETFTEEVVMPTGEEAQPSEIQVDMTTAAEKEQPKETRSLSKSLRSNQRPSRGGGHPIR